MAETAEPVEERRTYRVKDGKVYGALKAGETVQLTPSEAAPFLEELEEVPDEGRAKPKKASPAA